MADYIDAFRDTGSAQKFQPCSSCGRTFNPSTLVRHESVCQNQKKRKKFDSAKQRLGGVQQELANVKVNSSDSPIKPKKAANWRQKHEEFIATIRGARGVTLAQKKGEPLPPPPPPTINPDYVQCPHCSRRFNEHAAERHINFCKEQKARIGRPGSKTTAAVTRRTQYKPPLPGKRNSSSAAQSSRTAASSSAKPEYRTTEHVPRATGGGTSMGGSGSSPSSGPLGSKSKFRSSPDLRSKTLAEQRNKWSPSAASPSSSRRKPSREPNGMAVQRTKSGDVFSYFDSDEDIPVKPREIKHGRRNNLSDSDSEKTDSYRYDSHSTWEQPNSNSSGNSEWNSSGSSRRKHRNIAIRDPSPTLFDDFGIQSRSPVGQKSPFSAEASFHRVSSEHSLAGDKPKAHSAGRRPSKFCHECGTKYPVSSAKYCCECGTKRLYVEG